MIVRSDSDNGGLGDSDENGRTQSPRPLWW